MPIVSIVFWLIVVGVVLFLINTIVPMVSWMKTVINALVALVVIIWIAQHLGIATPISLRVR